MNHIIINSLSKKYGKKIIFNDLNMIITNEKYNFLIGDNGSGKSTFIKCINNLTSYQGVIDKGNLVISYCPEKLSLPDYITVKNFLLLLGRVNKIPQSALLKKIEYYLELFELQSYQNQYLLKLSLGTKQKISIIQSLIKDADIYIFDEPLNGIDKPAQSVFINLLKELKKKEKLIIITTHQIHKYPFRSINKIDFNHKEQYATIIKIA